MSHGPVVAAGTGAGACGGGGAEVAGATGTTASTTATHMPTAAGNRRLRVALPCVFAVMSRSTALWRPVNRSITGEATSMYLTHSGTASHGGVVAAAVVRNSQEKLVERLSLDNT